MARRKPRKTKKAENKVPQGYDSHFEAHLDKEILSDLWEYIPTPAPEPVEYHVDHKYHPDFVMVEDGKTIYLEAKGRFWDYQEYNKYIWIGKSLGEDAELVFLFAMPWAPMPNVKRRQDGSKFSHSEWAEKNGFRWFSEETLPEEWKK